jgi:hypothetical protein
MLQNVAEALEARAVVNTLYICGVYKKRLRIS